MELIKQYPLLFLLTVIAPVLVSLGTAVLGWVNLQNLAKDDAHKASVEKHLSEIGGNVGALKDQITTIRNYEAVLAQANQRDQVLSAVLAQYERMKAAAEAFHQSVEAGAETEELAKTVLNIIRTDLAPIRVERSLPQESLFIKIGANTFRVLFSVPMRTTPRLQFSDLPEGVTATVLENSRFGFTVAFTPLSSPVERFGYIADAEL